MNRNRPDDCAPGDSKSMAADSPIIAPTDKTAQRKAVAALRRAERRRARQLPCALSFRFRGGRR